MSQEEQAMQAIRKVIGDPLGMELYELWKEYEELRTVEAIYCKARFFRCGQKPWSLSFFLLKFSEPSSVHEAWEI